MSWRRGASFARVLAITRVDAPEPNSYNEVVVVHVDQFDKVEHEIGTDRPAVRLKLDVGELPGAEVILQVDEVANLPGGISNFGSQAGTEVLAQANQFVGLFF